MMVRNLEQKPAPAKMSFSAVLDEIHNHFVYVCKEKFGWSTVGNPEISSGEGHVVIRFEKDGKRMVFRVGKYGRSQLMRNMLAYRYVGGFGLMPEKIYHDGKCLIEEHVEGQALNSLVSDGAIIQLAQKLSAMHSLPAEGYGPLDFDNQGLYSSVSDYYDKFSLDAIDYSEVDLTPADSRFLEHAQASLTTLPDAMVTAKICIGHGDLWRSNILVDGHDLKVIDWDRIGAYPIEHDLIFVVDANFSDAQSDVFYKHYEHPVNPDLVRWFSLRRVFMNGGLNLKKKIAEIKKHRLILDEQPT